MTLKFLNQLVLTFILVAAIAACRSTSSKEVLAEVDGTPVTRDDVERSAGKTLANMRQQLYQLERQKLDEYIGALLLSKEAKNRNVSVSTLVDQEINAKVEAISDNDVQAFYDANKDRLAVDLEKVREQIREYLREGKIAARREEFFKGLRTKGNVITHLKSPPLHRAEVTMGGAPFKGAEKAQVSIVKFEDFECPFCKKVQPALNEVLKKYNGKVRLIHKDLPLQAIHPQAQLAAEGARCAGDQGKFWEYHDILYAKSPKFAADDLKAYAKELGLDSGKFDQCLASGKHRATVQKDLAEGAKLGLTGTPTFFINGREISGALPVESFAAIIDEELAQAK